MRPTDAACLAVVSVSALSRPDWCRLSHWHGFSNSLSGVDGQHTGQVVPCDLTIPNAGVGSPVGDTRVAACPRSPRSFSVLSRSRLAWYGGATAARRQPALRCSEPWPFRNIVHATCTDQDCEHAGLEHTALAASRGAARTKLSIHRGGSQAVEASRPPAALPGQARRAGTPRPLVAGTKELSVLVELQR